MGKNFSSCLLLSETTALSDIVKSVSKFLKFRLCGALACQPRVLGMPRERTAAGNWFGLLSQRYVRKRSRRAMHVTLANGAGSVHAWNTIVQSSRSVLSGDLSGKQHGTEGSLTSWALRAGSSRKASSQAFGILSCAA